MSERSISLTTLLAFACWAVGFTGGVANAFIGPDIGSIACGFFVAGGCLSVRSTVARSALSTTTVFQLGKEAEQRRITGPRSI